MEEKAGAVKSISGKGIPEDNCGSKGGRIMKIKKDVKPQIQNLPALKIKYTLVVPLMGIVDTLTMLSFYRNPATDGNLFAKVFFIVFAVVGAVFAYWGLMWKVTADGKAIKVCPVFSASRTVPLGELKKAVIYKKKKRDSHICYVLVDVRGEEIVKIYPIMKESSALLERIKRLGIKIEERIS